MYDFLIHNIAPIMFLSLIVFLLLGYPVAFSLAALGLAFGVVGIELGLLSPNLLQALPERVFGVMANDTLLAIPFFTFMGLILERSGMAEKLLDTVGKLFGPIRGGVAYAVIFVGALLAATTGVVAASVIAMGLISLPIMLRYGYDRRLAAGTIAASGTLAQIIPPSLVLIVLADQLGRSVGDMYLGAFVPGIVLTLFYMLYVFGMTVVYPNSAPALPPEARSFGPGAPYDKVMLAVIVPLVSVLWAMVTLFDPPLGIAPIRPLFSSASEVVLEIAMLAICAIVFVVYYFVLRTRAQPIAFAVWRIVADLLPPLVLIFLVLGTIFRGIATPTEGGAMGAAGALLLAIGNRKLSWDLLRQAGESTAKLSAFVIFILLGARVFSLTFYGVNGHIWVEEILKQTPGGMYGFLIIVNALIFFLAFFLDFFELAFIAVPLLVKAAETIFTIDPAAVEIAKSMGMAVIDGRVADVGPFMIWFGVLLGVNMQTSFMHPPFGFALFYLRSVAPTQAYKDTVTGLTMEPVRTSQIYWGAVPYVLIQVVMIGVVMLFPITVMWYNDTASKVDPSKVQIQGIDPFANPVGVGGLPGLGGPAGGLPGFDSGPAGLEPPKKP